MEQVLLTPAKFRQHPKRIPQKLYFPHDNNRIIFFRPMRKTVLYLFLILAGHAVFGQTIPPVAIPHDTISISIDSVIAPKPIVPTISTDSAQAIARNTLKKIVQKNLEEFENDKILAMQDKFFALLTIELENTREYLQRGIDSTGLDAEIMQIINWYKTAAEGVFSNKFTSQTSRNLALTNTILREATARLNARSEETAGHLEDLNQHKKKLDSLLSDSLLLNIPKDSVSFAEFFDKTVRAGAEFRSVYSELKKAINHIELLNARCQVVKNTLEIKLEEVEQYRKNLSRTALKKEFSNIWVPIENARPISEVLKISKEKNMVVLKFYLSNHAPTFILMLFVVIGLTFFLKYLDKTALKRLESDWDRNLHEVLKNQWLISIFIVLNVFQFFFDNPPFVFYSLGWIFSCIILSVLFWNKITHSLRLPWLILQIVFLAVVGINLVLLPSLPERIAMLLLSLITLAAAIYSIKNLRKREGNSRFLLIFVGLVILLETLSFILNIFGRYNLAKTALVGGLFNLVVVIQLLWTCYFIHEIFKIIALVFELKTSDREDQGPEPIETTPTSLLNFPAYLNILLLAGWFILFMRNFYAFTIFTEPFHEFMDTERTLGAYTFSIQSISNFFVIMFAAALLSKIISFFASDAHQNSSDSKKGLGSWLLLVRIAIFSVALFLAFAAAGIQMDKIAIIFSALSVGIGFGLQTLVNNLVSGLIIAFEKPVNVGDAVDINGQSGTMKSIGFRSSVVSTFDGSDVIIPNGDLLNAHLINWTLGDTKRRVEILVGVSYGTDLEKVKRILMGILEDEKRILRLPGPTILVNEFAASSIDFRILFWIDTAYHLWSGVKSDVLGQIDLEFKKHKIEIPFAQQDVNIRSITQLPGSDLNKSEKGFELEEPKDDEQAG